MLVTDQVIPGYAVRRIVSFVSVTAGGRGPDRPPPGGGLGFGASVTMFPAAESMSKSRRQYAWCLRVQLTHSELTEENPKIGWIRPSR